jgi:hypothetical protein
MTTVVSRLYSDAATADAVAEALRAEGHPDGHIDVIAGGKDKAALAKRIREARVSEAAAAAYAAKLGEGKALVVARVPFMPLGAALNAIRTVDRFPSVDAGVADQNEYIREEPREDLLPSQSMSIFKGGRRFLTDKVPPGHLVLTRKNALRDKGTISSRFGLKLLSDDKPRRSAMSGGGFMSTKFLPFPLLKPRKGELSVIPGGGTVFSDKLGLSLLSERKR